MSPRKIEAKKQKTDNPNTSPRSVDKRKSGKNRAAFNTNNNNKFVGRATETVVEDTRASLQGLPGSKENWKKKQ